MDQREVKVIDAIWSINTISEYLWRYHERAFKFVCFNSHIGSIQYTQRLSVFKSSLLIHSFAIYNFQPLDFVIEH